MPYRHGDPLPDSPEKLDGIMKSAVLLMMLEQGAAEKLMQVMKGAKLDPVSMHSEFEAAVTAFQSLDPDDGATVYLDIGSGSTNVMITHGSDLAFARRIELGGRDLDNEVAKQLKTTYEDGRAQRVKLEELVAPVGAGVGASERVLEGGADGSPTRMTRPVQRRVDLSEPLEILTDEVSMCLRYHESLFPSRAVNKAVFVGGEARHTALCQHVARVLSLPAQIADPLARVAREGKEPAVGVDLSQPQPGWAVALGLCLGKTDL